MGLFQTIGDLANPKLKKRQWQYQKAQAQKAIDDVVRAKEFRIKEDPREQAHLMQSSWARGLGKSSIATQDKERLTMIQQQRMASLNQGEEVARKYMRYLRKAKKHANVSAWLGLLDGVISLAAGAGMGSSQPQTMGYETSSGGAWDGGQIGYDYGSWGGGGW